MTPINYESDQPVKKEVEDKFQRYNYSKRIAETISSRTESDNIVFGLYGKWGEGKSSVLNFLEKELDNKKTISVHFNPWRYKDEDSILLSFFDLIAEALNSELKSTSDKVIDAVKKYGFLTKYLGFDISDANHLLSDRDVSYFKARIEQVLKTTNKKLVIFIDDIDRLDKDELFTLFRLVKLTADFSNTVYILSFDKEMVAKAIGQRFGNENDHDGTNFLEKIIQIPIELPNFRYTELRDYTLKLINDVLQKNNIIISKKEQKRYTDAFDDCLFQQINTPRNAIRYRNALEFSVPLLKEEVNIVDFLIFEGMKIFYPSHVEYIKSNPKLFIHNYILNQKLSISSLIEKNFNQKEEFEKLHISLSKSAKEGVLMTFIDLFPKLNQLYDKKMTFSEKEIENLLAHKRIASADYFERYISYSLAKNEISDVKFKSFLNSLHDMKGGDISVMFDEMVSTSSIYHFLNKLKLVKDELEWEQIQNIITLLFKNSNLLLEDKWSFFGYKSSVSQTTYFIISQLKRFDNTSTFKFLSENLSTIENKQFLINFLQDGIYDKNASDGVFSNSQIKEIYKIAIESILKPLDENQSIFDKYPSLSKEILFFWVKISIPKARRHITNYIKSEKNNVLELLKSFAGETMVTSNGGDETTSTIYTSDFDQESFVFLSKMKCVDEILKAITKIYSNEEIEKHDLVLSSRRHGPNTEINIATQFLYYYEESKKE